MDKRDLDAIRAILDDALDADRHHADARMAAAFQAHQLRLDATLDDAFERHLAAISEDIADLRSEMTGQFAAAASERERIAAKLDRVETRLGKFEEHEVDKRLQLDVRIAAVERQLGTAAQP